MTLKTKLTLGLGFLFIIIFTLAGFCSYYVGNLGHKAENILKDNYDSIVYYKNMMSAYDDMRTSVTGSALGSAEKINMAMPNFQLSAYIHKKTIMNQN